MLQQPASADDRDPISSSISKSRGRRLAAITATLLASAGVGALLVGHSGEVAGALDRIPLGMLLALAGLQAAIYLCRVSSWNVALRSGSAGLCAHQVRGVSGLSFAVNLVLPGYVGAAVRVGLLKRLGRGSDVGVGQLAMIDVLALVVEGAFLLVISIPLIAIFAPGYLWLSLALLAGIVCCVVAVGPLRARLGHLSWARSLAIFQNRRDLAFFSAPLLAVVVISPLRFWLALGALGIEAGLGLAVVSFIIVSVVAALPIGGTQAGIGGLGVLFASHGTEVILAAGVVLAATAALGALIYLVAVAAIWLAHRMREGQPALLPA